MGRICLRRCLTTVEAGLPEISTEEGREEEEEESRERQEKNEIAQEVAASIKMKASAPEDTKPTSQRTAGQKVRQNCDSSQIEDRDKRKLRNGTKRMS